MELRISQLDHNYTVEQTHPWGLINVSLGVRASSDVFTYVGKCRDFPESSVVKTRNFQSGGMGSDPGGELKTPYAMGHGQK